MKSAVPFTALRKTPLSLAVTQALLLSLGVTGHALAASTGETTLELPTLDVSSEALKAQGAAEDGYKVETATDIGFLKSRDIKDTPYAVHVISKEVIQNTQASSTDEILAKQPSVNTVAPDTSNFIQNYNVRGFALNPVSGSFAIDGLRTIFFKRVPTQDLESIELLNGLSGFLYGAALPGGFINFQTKKPVYDPIANVTVGNYGGSNYYAHTDLGGSLNQSDTLAYRLNILTRDGETAIDDNKISETDVSGALEWKVTDKVKLELDASHYNNRTQAGTVFWTYYPGLGATAPNAPDTSKNYAQKWMTDKVVTDRVASKVTWDLNDHFTIRGAVSHKESDRDEVLNVYNYITSSSGSYYPVLSYAGPSTVKEDAYYLYLDSKFNTGDIAHTITTGVSGVESKWYRSNSGSVILGTSSTSNPSYYSLPSLSYDNSQYLGNKYKYDNISIGDQIEINDQWEVLAGLTHTTIDTQTFTRTASNPGYDKEETTPSISVLYKPVPWLTTYASYMEGVEAGTTVSAAYTNYGEITPPIVSEQYEVGVKAELGGSLVSLALFNIDKPYEYGQADTDSSGNATGTSTYKQDGREVHRGIELTTEGKVTDKLTLMGGITLLDAKVKEGSESLEGKKPIAVPEVMAKLYGEYAISAVPGLTATAGVYYTGTQYVDTANSNKLPSYTIGDIGARYELTQFKTPVTLRVNVKNVTDKDYWLSPYYLGSPRTVAFSAETKF
ncbi:TonB-dependent siderophore receptor [Pokkaliibacter sp. MBI-7]|uniref:TonB-dependent receptor n=1 Tax=Pokkaliibacter sp. MBI-7 TaxID=3040600 RepID=UPI00244CDE52|nr:TonB-dependent siderophore receptor [Pokkaliibacter sp. MBI-7]MDH2433793.1 TonB-dependent siderophore receptor [Pokkaliibacter sp. MBI-7]